MAVAHAQGNIEGMAIQSPMEGLAVLTPISKGGRVTDLQEGDEVRAGQAIMTVVNPLEMRVTARVNQADIAQVTIGQSAEVRLEAYPDLVFPGRVEGISAIGTPSNYLKRIRYFSVVISIQGSHPKLLPDLTAIVDLQLENAKDVLLLPREAVAVRNGAAMVEVLENGKAKPQAVKLGPMNENEVVIESGIKEGTTVSLQIRSGNECGLCEYRFRQRCVV